MQNIAQEIETKIGALAGLRVIVAEDNVTNQMVVGQMLKVLGASFVMAADGVEALAVIKESRFDFALLDIEMPRMSGLELIESVRAMSGPVAQMPLIALTAYVMREHRERIFAAGADGIIAKPLMSIEDLGRDILQHLEGKPALVEEKFTEQDKSSQIDRVIFDGLIEAIGPESAAELFEQVLNDICSVSKGISAGHASGDTEIIRGQSHILISVAGSLGATYLQNAAQSLNTVARSGDDREDLVQACLDGLQSLREFIQSQQGGL